MAYALLDHPDLGDRRPSAMMAEMLSLRYETTAPDSLFLALFLRRLPPSISPTTSQRRTIQRRQRCRSTQILSGTPGIQRQSPLIQILWQPCRSTPLRPPAVHSLLIAAPGRRIAAVEDASLPAAPHLDAQMARRFAGSTGRTVLMLQAAASPVIGRKTRSPPWAAQCSRRPHLSPGFGL
jgi:hypothetical protein